MINLEEQCVTFGRLDLIRVSETGERVMEEKQDLQHERSEIIDVIAGIRSELSEKYTVKNIGIFGSFSRGKGGSESDVDIIVELGEQTFDHYMDLKFRLEEVLARPVDLVIAETLKPLLRPVIEREVIYV